MLGVTTSTGDRIIRELTSWIEANVELPLRPNKALGAGHYGVVYSTVGRTDLVCKITTDPTEGSFIAQAMAIQDGFPDGIVKYYRIDLVDTLYHNRPVFILWREAAHDVGVIIKTDMYSMFKNRLTWEEREYRALANSMYVFRMNSDAARTSINRATNRQATLIEAKRLEDWARDRIEIDSNRLFHHSITGPEVKDLLPARASHWRGAQRVAIGLEACRVVAEMMVHESNITTYVGGALGYYLEHDILLCDIHNGNIGRVTREDFYEPIIAITDPGHSVNISV